MVERIVNAEFGQELTTSPGEGPQAGNIWMARRNDGAQRRGSSLIITPENFVAAFDGLIPGLSVSYEKPIVVPTGLGAVVVAPERTYVRTNEDRVYPWRDTGGRDQWDDDQIRGELQHDGKVLSEGVQP
jgi:hypothetical protein